MPALDDLPRLVVLPGAALLGAAVVIAEVWGLSVISLKPLTAERHFCDHEVAVLLNSRDPIEIQRAGILVHEVGCDVTRRIEARAP